MDEHRYSWDNFSAVWGCAKSVVVWGLSSAVPDGISCVWLFFLFIPSMLCVPITFCINGVSYESLWKYFFGGEGLDLVPHNFLGCLQLSMGKRRSEKLYLISLPSLWLERCWNHSSCPKGPAAVGCATECSDIAQSLSNTDFFTPRLNCHRPRTTKSLILQLESHR